MIREQELFLPAGLVAEWKDNPHCGESFRQWLDEFPYKVIDAAQANEPPQAGGGGPGAGGGGDGPGPSPNKRARTETAPEIDASLIVSEATQALIQEVKLGNGMPVIHLRSESAVFLWNGTEKNFVQTDFCLAFFGSGSYKILKANQEVPAKGVLLEFKDSSDQIVLNGVIQTISEAVNAMRIKKPDCKVCYYQIVEGESVQNFSLKQTHKVVFVRKDEEQQVLAKHNVASQIPFNDRSSCV